MKTTILIAFVLLFSSCGGSGNTATPIPVQIEDLRDIGTWGLFEVTEVTRNSSGYTDPPLTFTIDGELLTRINDGPFDEEGWLDFFYQGRGIFLGGLDNTFDQRGSILPPPKWTDVVFRWSWRDDPDPEKMKAAQDVGISISIDRESVDPQVLVIWSVRSFIKDPISKEFLTSESSFTRLTYRPLR